MDQENIGLFMYVTRHIPIESQDLMDSIFHCQEDFSNGTFFDGFPNSVLLLFFLAWQCND